MTARDPDVERERRARERRERERARAAKPTPSARPARPARSGRAPAPVAAAARERHEGLVGWLARNVVSLPRTIGRLPQLLARTARGFALEVAAVLAGIARFVLRLVPGGARIAERRSGTLAQSRPAATAADDARNPRRQRAPRTPAELRAASERRARLRQRLRIGAAAAIVVAIGVAWLVVPASDLFRIRHVEVTGAAAVDDLQVRERVDSLLAGKTVFTVDRDAVAERIEELPFVRRATIERHLPGGLELHVEEYRPLALAYGDGDFWLVAHDGRVLAKVDGDAWKGRIPTIVLRGDDIEPGMRLDDEPALQLLESVPADSAISFDTIGVDDDGQLTATMPDGVDVRLGRPTELLLKAAVVARMVEIAARHGEDLLYVDVSVPGKPAVCLDEVAACHLPRGPRTEDDEPTGAHARTAQAAQAGDDAA
jgi:cell division septal protein FtsQ